MPHYLYATSTPESMNRQLRDSLQSSKETFFMEAHSGLSARIVSDHGFAGVWASGLSISAALGIRDRNEAPWSHILDIVEYMADASTVPVLVDADTGFGDFNTARRVIMKLSQRRASGACVEDKLFPKTNSFLGKGQPLEDVATFCGKIKAMQDAKLYDDFSVIARVEALVSGLGMNEALHRAECYADAGADAILIHSKQSTSSEIIEFARHWDSRVPLVIVPTKYFTAPTKQFIDAGITNIIWANHNLRASAVAMQSICATIQRDNNLIKAESIVLPLSDLFDITREDEYQKAADKYTPVEIAE